MTGPEEWREQFLDQNKQFLPREVDIDDLDKGFIGFIGDDLGIAYRRERSTSTFFNTPKVE